MKKIIFLLFCLLSSLTISSQTIYKYNTIEHVDKYDDNIKKEHVKTIVNYKLDEGLIIVDTKGKTPTTYYITRLDDIEQYGTPDSIINLVENVYGYETHFYCVAEKDTAAYMSFVREKEAEFLANKISTDKYLQYIYDDNPFIVTLVDRTIVGQYTGDFITRRFWIRKNKGDRIIYKIE